MAFNDENLRPGCPLWIVAQPSCSALARKIDWYLNFQIMKAECHQTPAAPPELVGIENEWGIEKNEVAVPGNAPLLIPSHALLPNKQTVVVPFAGDAEPWAKAVHDVWKGLKSPRMRIFLPDELSKEAFKKAWGQGAQKDALDEIEFADRGRIG